MPRMRILNTVERYDFDFPPTFNSLQRKKYFYFSDTLYHMVSGLSLIHICSHGCVVDDNHPLMDGSKHRVKVIGDKPGEKSGFYVAHLDGHPAGYFKNNRSGLETRWKAKGYSLSLIHI